MKEALQKRHNLFFLLVIFFGLILILLEPPFVCPDENAHFLNICHISHGNLFADVEEGAVGVTISQEERDYLSRYGGYYNGVDNENRYSYAKAQELRTRPASEEMVFVPTHYASINPTAYLIPAAVVFLFRLLFSVNAYHVLLIAKITNLILYALLARWALQKTKALPNTMFILALMPMSIFQGASTSYDALLIPASFLLFAYATHLLRTDDPLTWRDIVGVCIACACLFGVKVAYAPLVLILLSIAIKRFGDFKKWLLCVFLVGAMGVIFYLAPAVINGRITADVVTTLSPLEMAQKEFFASHWYRFPLILLCTFGRYCAVWAEGFIGVLGWLDTHFSPVFIVLFALGLLAVALSEICNTAGITKKTRILSLCGVAIFYCGTVYTMYLEWNPVLVGVVGGWLAYGGQGRYFIPIALFTLIAFANTRFQRVKQREKIEAVRQIAVPIFSSVALLATVLLLLLRYWF
jgi:uncharacterized membrane protein